MFTFNTGGITLDVDKQYVAFVDTGGVPLAVGGSVGIVSDNPYDGGHFVMRPTPAWGISPAPWFVRIQSDAAFIAVFEPIPEPSTIVLISCGILGLLGICVKRRRKAQ